MIECVSDSILKKLKAGEWTNIAVVFKNNKREFYISGKNVGNCEIKTKKGVSNNFNDNNLIMGKTSRLPKRPMNCRRS